MGGESAGKSLFIVKMKEVTQNSGLDECDILVANEGTLPTVGVELNTIKIGNDRTVCFREIGSALSSRWENYYEGCKDIIFLVDGSDLAHVAVSFVLLHEILAAIFSSVEKHVLLAINKSDLVDRKTLIQVQNFLRIDELQETGRVEVIVGSSMDGSLCTDALAWLTSRHT